MIIVIVIGCGAERNYLLFVRFFFSSFTTTHHTLKSLCWFRIGWCKNHQQPGTGRAGWWLGNGGTETHETYAFWIVKYGSRKNHSCTFYSCSLLFTIFPPDIRFWTYTTDDTFFLASLSLAHSYTHSTISATKGNGVLCRLFRKYRTICYRNTDCFGNGTQKNVEETFRFLLLFKSDLQFHRNFSFYSFVSCQTVRKNKKWNLKII